MRSTTTLLRDIIDPMRRFRALDELNLSEKHVIECNGCNRSWETTSKREVLDAIRHGKAGCGVRKGKLTKA